MINSKDYEIRLDSIFGKGSFWVHRTMRTVFDPYSSEWHSTNLDRKIEILNTIIENGESLKTIIVEYKQRYLDADRKDIADSIEDSLSILLEYSLLK
jgi:hypothetical protein